MTTTWQPTGLGLDIFRDRYAIHETETWEEACARVAKHVAAAEEVNEAFYFSEFYADLVDGYFMGGGRIMYGAGKPKAQLLNCFVIPTGDSREAWGQAFYDTTVISGLGGGVGLNAGSIRPRGSLIRGTGGRATGSVSFMEAVNGIGEVIKGGGGRRTALMLSLPVQHPDTLEFLDAKLDLGRLNNANVSIILSMPTEEFVSKVHNGEELELEFEGQSHGTINARYLWDRLVRNSWTSGEPGVLNGYLANQQNNIWYYKPLVTTNPCGEIWLEEYGCCDLGALVLPRFVSGGVMDWSRLKRSIRNGVRFLDDVLTVNHYPLPAIEANCKAVRRLGLGVMGLHNMLLELGIKYSSPAALAYLDYLFEFIKVEAYKASIDLAAEKGPFPAYSDQLLESGFAQTLSADLRRQIARYGLRNCALLTIAPTGTTALVQGVSGGIEPLPAPVYFRRYYEKREDEDNKLKRELVVDPLYAKYGSLYEGAHEITPSGHFAVQKVIQRHIDNAVSKTINLPKDIPIEELSEIWLEYLPYCKGTTLYRDGSRAEQPIEPVSSEDIPAVLAEYGISNLNPSFSAALQLEQECPEGYCEIPMQRVV